MTNFFLQFFSVNLKAAILVGAVLILRKLFHRAPKSVSVALWGLVALRLLMPFRIQSPLSLMPDLSWMRGDSPVYITQAAPAETGFVQFPLEVNPEDAVYASPDVLSDSSLFSNDPASVPAAAEIEETAQPVSRFHAAEDIAALVWVIGAAVMLCYAAVSAVRLKRRVKSAKPDVLEPGVFCGGTDTPFVMGVFSPKIYLPEALSDSARKSVLLHERTHIKRGDHLIKLFGFLLLSLCWFNPAIWLAYYLLARDIELACDERVIRDMDASAKRGYAEALLACSLPHRRMPGCPAAFAEIGVKTRIRNVARYRKPALWLSVLAAFAAVCTAVCGLTDSAHPAFAMEPIADSLLTDAIEDAFQMKKKGKGIRCAEAHTVLEETIKPHGFTPYRFVTASVMVQTYDCTGEEPVCTDCVQKPMGFFFKGSMLAGSVDLSDPNFSETHTARMMAENMPETDLTKQARRDLYITQAKSCAEQMGVKLPAASGQYICQDVYEHEMPLMVKFTLTEDGKFMMTLAAFSSYMPYGDYVICGNTLSLDGKYIFRIDENDPNTYIFDEAQSLPIMKYRYAEKDTDVHAPFEGGARFTKAEE